MLLHLGGEVSIFTSEIIAILDGRSVKKSATTRDFLERSKKKVIAVTPNIRKEKSVIITEDKIYLSAISSLTLKKRTGRSGLI